MKVYVEIDIKGNGEPGQAGGPDLDQAINDAIEGMDLEGWDLHKVMVYLQNPVKVNKEIMNTRVLVLRRTAEHIEEHYWPDANILKGLADELEEQ